MSKLNPYLTFNGNCREVFDFYRTVFGGEFAAYMTFADGPPEYEFPENEKGLIMHVSLPVGDSMLMGSDTSSAFGPLAVTGTNFSISIDVESNARADELFAQLSEGGSVKMPMADTFWGSYFGLCTDQYGVSWMISHNKDQG